MVVEDIKWFKRSRLPPKALLPYAGLPEGDEGYYNKK